MKLAWPLIAGTLLAAPGSALAQNSQFTSMAEKALGEPFVGVTTDGTPRPDLFEIEPTGIPMDAVRTAAQGFLDSLPEDVRETVIYPVESDEWRHWSNFHQFPGRNGLSMEDMSDAQREATYNLLRASLSAKGYETSRDIMRLNHHLGELVDNFEEYGEFKYWVTVFGTPSSEEPWGWQFEGHHLVINYFLLGDQLVMTPTFMGSEPVRAQSGKYAGTEVLQEEQDAGLAFLHLLPEDLRERAIIGGKEGRSNALGELFKDNIVVPYEGLPAKDLDQETLKALTGLIALFLESLPEDQASRKMMEVLDHLDETYFAWRGGTDDESVYYFRIQSPVVFIEFDHQGLIALEGDWNLPSRRHVHTVIRTPNGNDYGRDLLRQHYEEAAADPDHGHSHPHRPQAK
ncbi:DUF3500 domain-containing protein [Roseibium aggregatum]|uniref:DUF3500 domain-containing protein n=1 Tax=Roseibium aggregatum TaxID=187304 RepID=A0A939EEY4_9HYPH|nr:DUF3500 domain-containing protein [Roseibium aggregatum]MBN9672001.1 DUF3500 domain-containing protein [Roseibium aggregatum]